MHLAAGADLDSLGMPLAATCTDGVQNGNETGVDCGGPCSPAKKCGVGAGCSAATDCSTGYCAASSLTCADGECEVLAADSAVCWDQGGAASLLCGSIHGRVPDVLMMSAGRIQVHSHA
jgi:hypothetical protein